MSRTHRKNLSGLASALERIEAIAMRQAIPEFLRHVTALDLTTAQVSSLYHLTVHGHRSVSELAEAVGLSMPATSALVERLVQRELVERAEDPDNRRQKRLALTPHGKALVEQLEQARSGAFLRLFGTLPPALRERFEQVLIQVADALPASLRQEE
jgi:DNA-binding MarR family transcriptional regulator